MKKAGKTLQILLTSLKGKIFKKKLLKFQPNKKSKDQVSG